ncbi:hypothetical protein ABID08_004867 [Rhizobium binae]|uniref:DUF2092 domain-containing protein n=1 Tax=Rhizobium binae TaxID=1138190 RepID=A0ABV2MM05_9HYPH|nr:DUF2092 domain-containing protein [Rhizobium binae]MBX4969526.1 DUF2092 domain-containing protein [Rhizobium binae]MBX4993709.1 DUF2092 domain-containing protein [Rhizobium binae]NKL46773.1 DUF2092 domain-containing protein [Rhizobium leguminosarum bv. viciae]QSY83398.1 DUF2092 domain-containing protein [Rhizobium binae]
MEVCNGLRRPLTKVRRPEVATNRFVDGAGARGVIAMLRSVVQTAAFGVLVGFSTLPTARADEPAPSFKPEISDEAATAVSQMGKTLHARDLSITARTVSVYLDEFGQPLHIFHTMKIAARRPDRIAVEFIGDDGRHDLFYDGKAASVLFPDRKEYMTIPASGDISSALDEIADKLDFDFPLGVLFAGSPDDVLLGDAMAARQVGTATVDGIECRHLLFSQKSGIDVELWVEKNDAAKPHRLVVTYPLLQGQPSFVAEFTSWTTQPPLSDSEFTFEPPADAKKIDPTPAVASGSEGSR